MNGYRFFLLSIFIPLVASCSSPNTADPMRQPLLANACKGIPPRNILGSSPVIYDVSASVFLTKNGSVDIRGSVGGNGLANYGGAHIVDGRCVGTMASFDARGKVPVYHIEVAREGDSGEFIVFVADGTVPFADQVSGKADGYDYQVRIYPQ